MGIDGLRQAAQLVRTHLATLSAADRTAQLSTIASLIYTDRLNNPPIHPHDPDAVDEVCHRFSAILADHLHLAALVLADAGYARGEAPHQVLDDLVRRRLGGYH